MTKVKTWWKDFLERLGKAGEKEFGNKPPECCNPPQMDTRTPKDKKN